MENEELDFGGNIQSAGADLSSKETTATDINGDKAETEDITENHSAEQNNGNNGEDKTTSSSTGGLEVGSVVELDGKEYTVADNGDIVDADGKVFVEASNVENWLKDFEDNQNNEDNISVNSVIEAIGVNVTDDKGNPVQFADGVEGIKSYFNEVLNIKGKEYQEGAINKLFNDAPILKEFIDYLTVNNGDPRGFGEIRDRSGITVDKDNIEQQKAIIRTAAKEFGNSSLSDGYIKYLEESGNLYNEAVVQLDSLQKADAAFKQQIAKNAEAARQQELVETKAYWDSVEKIITSRNIAGYKIPDSFVREVDGKKMTFTPNDFLAYVSEPKFVDENNNKITGYQRDLNAMSDEDVLNADLLNAYLKFTGGSYKDLVDMAIADKEVKRLKLVAKQHRSTPSVRKPNKGNSGKVNNDDIAFG